MYCIGAGAIAFLGTFWGFVFQCKTCPRDVLAIYPPTHIHLLCHPIAWPLYNVITSATAFNATATALPLSTNLAIAASLATAVCSVPATAQATATSSAHKYSVLQNSLTILRTIRASLNGISTTLPALGGVSSQTEHNLLKCCASPSALFRRVMVSPRITVTSFISFNYTLRMGIQG